MRRKTKREALKVARKVLDALKGGGVIEKEGEVDVRVGGKRQPKPKRQAKPQGRRR